MTELESSSTLYDGVSLTPNVVSRAYGALRDLGIVAIAWWFARCGGDWSAQPEDADAEGALYFH